MGEIPKLYVDTIEVMARVVAVAKAKLQPTPRFAMPPRDVHIAVALCDLPNKDLVARNETALYVLEVCRATAIRMGGTANEPTLVMLEIALDTAELPYERVPLDALGVEVGSFGSS